ncbi:four helix bundle protein [Prolixibacter bellariivorans]|uniref:Four helix bundle protein n=1 Tax=Prolixibacter bellariivorans TaxID=314319 RepID=A0A5M4B0Q5_9BACT|nr:four helix bundle protein [Prolixibacter bellariivorans]GET33742.1 four helix bundle protein [Prolixibacter bellariivorans]
MPHAFDKLEVWKRSFNLTLRIYLEFEKYPIYALREQILRSSLSIPSNIAEGAERSSNKDFIRFLHIAKGSSAELRTQLMLVEKLNNHSSKTVTEMIKELNEISSMLHGLIERLKQQL